MPKKRRKRKSKLLKRLFLIIALVFLLYILPCYILDIRIKNIYIKNNNILKDQEIIELANLEDYPNIYKTKSKDIEEKIKTNNFIKECKVKKGLFNKITIEIEEYKVLFIRVDTNKIVLENKKELDYTKELVDIPYLINYVPDTKYEKLVSKLIEIDEQVLSKVSEIKYEPNKYDEDRFLLYMNDGNYVYVTLTKFDILNKYNETVTKLEGKQGTLYFDSGNYFEIRK